MKAIISQTVIGKTGEQIHAERAETVKMLEDRGYEVVNPVFNELGSLTPLKALAKFLADINDVDLVYFMPDWNNSYGWKIVHECCLLYDVKFEEA